MDKIYTFLDLFAGCGGLSEGFIQAKYKPIAHVEMDKAACFSLKTRMAYHWLKAHGKTKIYSNYLNGTISRKELYQEVPSEIIDSVINEEIGDKTISKIFLLIDQKINEDLDFIIGGPPCQAYSLVGRARDEHSMKNDKRNFLFNYYAKFLEHYKPKIFVFENVLGLFSAKDISGKKYFDMMLKRFQDVGYTTTTHVFSADQYGVPQKRKRVIIIGTREDIILNNFFLNLKDVPVCINDIFKDLPSIKSGEGSFLPCNTGKACDYLSEINVIDNSMPVTFHYSRPNNKQDLMIYKLVVEKWNNSKIRLNYNDLPNKLKTHKNTQSFTDRFKVVAGNLHVSHTVVAHIAKDGHYYIHPDIKQNRSLSPREAARLQTFPDNYFFEAVSETPAMATAFRQIGNAVPVYLAKQIAEVLRKNLQWKKK